MLVLKCRAALLECLKKADIPGPSFSSDGIVSVHSGKVASSKLTAAGLTSCPFFTLAGFMSSSASARRQKNYQDIIFCLILSGAPALKHVP